MKTVYIIGKKHTENTGGADASDSWSRDSTSTDWTISGVSLVDKGSLESIVTNHTGKIYLLYAIYSSGDSFGNDESYYLDPIWVFNDLDLLIKAKDKIRAHYQWFKDSYGSYKKQTKKELKEFENQDSVDIEIEDGKTMTVHAAWNGYFESLNELDFIEGII